jgi:coproporphyrinogen III oxidase
MKQQALTWFHKLQDDIWNVWKQTDGSGKVNEWGSGEYRIWTGDVYEKAGVAFSNVKNTLPAQLGDLAGQPFESFGVSVVVHTGNPNTPGLHFNTRYITTPNKAWFGGGMDITPYVDNHPLINWYHNKLMTMCDKHNENYYEKFSKDCDDYFYLPHREEHRGAGGIFFDYLPAPIGDTQGWPQTQENWKFVQDVGTTFIEVMQYVVDNTANIKFTHEDKNKQLIKRGRYVEFNLLYDKGTRFGLEAGGHTEAILMSMPPNARWT